MTSIDDIDRLNRKRRKIIVEFHRLRATQPKSKKFILIQQVAKRLDYVLDKNRSSSYVMRVIREWES
jgi:hypothetical protein